jgi:N-acetyl-anhydromuramyl-L-alanine amidase AmpD
MEHLQITDKPSPNFRQGRGGYKPLAIVIHVMEGTLPGTDSWFNQIRSHVSSHWGIGRNGELHRYVREEDTAQHAGTVDRPQWKLIKPGINPNLYTIGIENEGHCGDVMTDAQLHTNAAVIAAAAARWGFPVDEQHVIPHHYIRFMKPCPGASFAGADGFNLSRLILAAQLKV